MEVADRPAAATGPEAGTAEDLHKAAPWLPHPSTRPSSRSTFRMSSSVSSPHSTPCDNGLQLTLRFKGSIIGKAGSKINEIRQVSQCQIKISEPGENTPGANPSERVGLASYKSDETNHSDTFLS